MEIGIAQLMASFAYEGLSDHQLYQDELAIAVAAEEHGYDHVWAVEHHFEDYSLCPDNCVYLANVAARTSRIKLATGAVILPWNAQPLRVAEKLALLDQLSGGRAILGLGRGLARREFDQFGIPMSESRERYDEAAPLVLEALETGWFPEHHGRYYDQPRAPLRPGPYSKEWRQTRFTQVAMSPDSAEQAAKLGAQMMAFNYKPPAQQKQEYEDYKAAFRRYHGREPRPMILTEMMICDSNAARARENAEKYIANYGISVLDHYEMLGEQFKASGGYPTYAAAAEAMRNVGKENVIKGYVEQQVWGTPDQILRKFEDRFAFMGRYGVLCVFRYGGAPQDVALRSLELFAKEVMPVLRTWGERKAAA
ncbi:MAG: LLM class flavin-dependent oxidoreductase [Gammaproteobacteria bacterium]|nr:LLM class flavin-dependent oxidoreductase [Gammaproteobacteria bacterium]MBI5616818.1 LLM class flavin-dependent oxidoreductase [Gammaproteobacteria bacterium]